MYSWLDNRPKWHRESRPRLITSIAVSAVLAAAFITLTTFQPDDDVADELDVFIVAPEVPAELEPVVEEIVQPEVEEVVEETLDEILPEQVAVTEQEALQEESVEPRTDWYAQMDAVVDRVMAEEAKSYSLNPVQDELRRQAAEKFYASRAPVKKKIWENVEVDQLGRKILVSGDCHRVIDDPSAARQDAFREFHQYIVFCSHHKPGPKELPWVEEIRERHVYLQPDIGRDDTRTDVLAELQ